MKNVSTISKITERGQITLPKKIRSLSSFAHARAVAFTESAGVVTIQPVTTPTTNDRTTEHATLLDHSMKEWSDTAHDNLFDFS